MHADRIISWCCQKIQAFLRQQKKIKKKSHSISSYQSVSGRTTLYDPWTVSQALWEAVHRTLLEPACWDRLQIGQRSSQVVDQTHPYVCKSNNFKMRKGVKVCTSHKLGKHMRACQTGLSQAKQWHHLFDTSIFQFYILLTLFWYHISIKCHT